MPFKYVRRGCAGLDSPPCEILLTRDPGTARMRKRVAAREKRNGDALMDPGAGRRYVAATRIQLAGRLAGEAKRVPDTLVTNQPSRAR